MGLDMYLTARRSLFYNPEWHNNPLAAEINALLKKQLVAEGSTFPAGDVNNGIGGEIKIAAAYWRKANAIHGWFVSNVQDGEDDCREYYVPREKLVELHQLCKDVLDGTAKKEDLPPTGGFFFGDTENDEWYREDLKNTVEQIDVALTLPGMWDFEYRASW